MHLQDIQSKVAQTNYDNGWHDRYHAVKADDPTAAVEHIIVKLALIGTEASEAIEDVRDRGVEALARPLIETRDVTKSHLAKPDGVAAELADVVIRALDTAALLGIDLESVIKAKLKYNATRGKHHGGKAA